MIYLSFFYDKLIKRSRGGTSILFYIYKILQDLFFKMTKWRTYLIFTQVCTLYIRTTVHMIHRILYALYSYICIFLVLQFIESSKRFQDGKLRPVWKLLSLPTDKSTIWCNINVDSNTC